MVPNEVLIQDPCPFGLPEILTGAQLWLICILRPSGGVVGQLSWPGCSQRGEGIATRRGSIPAAFDAGHQGMSVRVLDNEGV